MFWPLLLTVKFASPPLARALSWAYWWRFWYLFMAKDALLVGYFVCNLESIWIGFLLLGWWCGWFGPIVNLLAPPIDVCGVIPPLDFSLLKAWFWVGCEVLLDWDDVLWILPFWTVPDPLIATWSKVLRALVDETAVWEVFMLCWGGLRCLSLDANR